MKKGTLLFVILILSIMSHAQGLEFAHGTWKDAVAQAKREKKLLYVDFYTTWCGPCKIMAAQIFPKTEAGEKYNKLFVNFKIDAEKGEGIDLAKKYDVQGYPTNLYIDPKDENVVYRVMGSSDMSEFLNRADVALLEHKDPLKWNDYQAKFDKGNRDKQFLVAYLEKSKRLDKYNDKALDAYVEKYMSNKLDEAHVKFLIKNTRTLDNKAVGLLASNRGLVNNSFQDIRPDYFSLWVQRLPYNTLQKAIDNKDQRLLKTIEEGIKEYKIKESGVSGIFFYRKEYFNKTGDKEAGWKASLDEANYIGNITDEQLKSLDKQQFEDVRASILSQVKAMGAREDQYERSIEATLQKNPDMRKPATLSAASSLNELAWQVFEKRSDDKQSVQFALGWSKRSLELANGSGSWPLFADTYANLLFLNGEKEQAIALEEAAVNKAKELEMDGIEGFEETLAKMKSSK